jgi:hypothetical protein
MSQGIVGPRTDGGNFDCQIPRSGVRLLSNDASRGGKNGSFSSSGSLLVWRYV